MPSGTMDSSEWSNCFLTSSRSFLRASCRQRSASWPDHALFIEKTVPGPGQITIARAFVRSFTTAKPEEYQDLRGFYQKVAAADQAQLVLAKTASTETGN